MSDADRFDAMSPLRQAWFARQYHLQLGDEDKTVEATENVLKARVDAGVPNATELASALAYQAQRLANDGKSDLALSTALAAADMAPAMPGAHLSAALVQLKQGGVGGAATSLVGAARASMSSLGPSMRMAGNLLFAALLAVAASAIAFIVLVGTRHARQFLHDLHHALADRVSGPVVLLTAGAVAALPLLVGLGPVAELAWLIVILWLYLSVPERAAAGVILAVILAMPWIAGWGAGFVTFFGSEAALLTQARDEALSPSQVDELQALVNMNPKDHDLVTTLGLHYKRTGQYGNAMALLKRAASLPGAPAGARNNVGLLQYAMGDQDAAIASFEAAAAGDATLFAPLYNLTEIHAERTESDAADGARGRARRVDPVRLETLEEAGRADRPARLAEGTPLVSAAYLNRVFLESPVSDQAMRARVFGARAGTVADAFWQKWVTGVPRAGLLFVAVAAALACGLLSLLSRKAKPATPCPQCAAPVCIACHGAPRLDGLCPPCSAAFITGTDIDPDERKAQEQRVARRKRRARLSRRVLGLVPGLGHIAAGHPLMGGTWLVLASLAAAWLVLWPGMLAPPHDLGIRILVLTPWVLLLGFLVLLSVYRAGKLEGK
jgi:tetratricopeptide (TPR) repeat protein